MILECYSFCYCWSKLSLQSVSSLVMSLPRSENEAAVYLKASHAPTLIILVERRTSNWGGVMR